MADTNYRGPVNSLGPLMGNVSTAAGSPVAVTEPLDGPDITYQGDVFPDPRFYPFNKDSLKAGRAPAFMNNPFVSLVDAIPELHAVNNIAASQHITASTALTLATTCVGGAAVSTYFSHGCPAVVPMIPLPANTGASFPTSGAVVNALALDFGFSVGTTTAGSATVASVPDTSLFYVGQWICIGGAGNSGKTRGLIAQVTAVGTSTLTISPAASGSLTAAPIGSANFYGSFPAQGAANAANPYINGGVAAVFNPAEAIARGVVIVASNSAAVGGTFTVAGYDIYGQAMTEAITSVPATDSSQTVYGKKAFKYIVSVTPSNTDATYNYTVGTSDVFGIHIRTVEWETVLATWAGAIMTSSTGWLTADRTSPATTTTGDVRGVIQTSTIGGGTGIGSSASDNARRLSIKVSPTPWAMTAATPINPVPLFGVAQV